MYGSKDLSGVMKITLDNIIMNEVPMKF